MTHNNLFKNLFLVLSALLFVSCDKEFNTIGSDVIGNTNFEFNDGVLQNVKVYNQQIPGIETSNLQINHLGVFENKAFGTTTASFVTELSLARLAPTFTKAEIDSVVLTVPYFSKLINAETKQYELLSKYGSGSINLKVFRSGLTLNNFDPTTGFQTPQKYFSNQDALFTSKIDGETLNDDTNPSESTAFEPSAKQYIKFKIDPVTNLPIKEVDSVRSPRMRLHLKKKTFEDMIKSPDKLKDNEIFRDYFKGLYFQVQEAQKGTLLALDFTNGDVTIFYKDDKIETPANPNPKRVLKSLTLRMVGKTVNLFKNNNLPDYTNAIANPNFKAGDPKLYLKGGQGSIAFIELFTPAQLEKLKNDNVLINDASITFNVDPSQATNFSELRRLYLYDADKNRNIVDYDNDRSTNVSDSKLNKSVYGGILEKVIVNNIETYRYKFKITEHINRIIREKTNTKENVRLGLAVSDNINLFAFGANDVEITAPSETDANKKFKSVPFSSIINPLGTVLYGNTNDKNQVEFKIYYTKSNN
jgi:hypothetical protein